MLMKDIKVGEEYASTEWGSFDHIDLFLGYGRPESQPPKGSDWAKAWREALRKTSFYGKRVRVIEKRVPVGHYSRPGVLVQNLDRETGEPDGEPVAVRTVQLAMEWERLRAVYLDVMSAYEESIEEDRKRRAAYKQEERERQARAWMERVFEGARSDLKDMVALGAIEKFDDISVQNLVAHRHPDGNPHLNGEQD
jgi:hypothetical protein